MLQPFSSLAVRNYGETALSERAPICTNRECRKTVDVRPNEPIGIALRYRFPPKSRAKNQGFSGALLAIQTH